MISSEIKMRVAQNCEGYRTSYGMEFINSISYGSESCSSCANYVRGKCIEELFDEVRETIRVN
jgi:hypothetical protein